VSQMKRLPIGILGSGKGSNCRAILGRIRSGDLAAEARLVVSDVLDAPVLDLAREFGIANAYLPPGRFRTRLEPEVEEQLVQMCALPVSNLSFSPGSCVFCTNQC